MPVPPAGFAHAYYRLYAYVRPDGLRAAGAATASSRSWPPAESLAFHGSCSEVYLEKAFEGTPFAPPSRLPVARELGETSIAFLTHPTLTPENIATMTKAIGEVFSEASA